MDIMSSIEGYKKKTILINMLTKYYCYTLYNALSIAFYQEKTSWIDSLIFWHLLSMHDIICVHQGGSNKHE